MMWEIVFSEEAKKDRAALDGSVRKQVLSAIYKVAQNPLPKSEGGYGTPLRGNLAGLCKIKLLKLGIRVVYELVKTETSMKIIVIAARADDEVYEMAVKRNKLK
ncbi:MAG: type II toxin-antitoxin system RelE/ParE family toxin [Oscillospiraceae bacterium]|nr:type II toxin-antitoxin system RelE/ParE family toxin [Oscillospiraceae bacterium]